MVHKNEVVQKKVRGVGHKRNEEEEKRGARTL
jgi:hypothetical protein